MLENKYVIIGLDPIIRFKKYLLLIHSNDSASQRPWLPRRKKRKVKEAAKPNSLENLMQSAYLSKAWVLRNKVQLYSVKHCNLAVQV